MRQSVSNYVLLVAAISCIYVLLRTRLQSLGQNKLSSRYLIHLYRKTRKTEKIALFMTAKLELYRGPSTIENMRHEPGGGYGSVGGDWVVVGEKGRNTHPDLHKAINNRS